MKRRRHAQRGQAIYEMAIVMPFVLLTFFSTLYLMRAAVISERTEVSLRYASLMSLGQQSFDQYSLHAVAVNMLTLPGRNSACQEPPNFDAFAQSNAYNIGNGNKYIKFYQPLPNQISMSCTQTTANPTPSRPFSVQNVNQLYAGGVLTQADSPLFGPATVLGLSNAKTTNIQRWVDVAYDLPPTLALHCLPDLVTAFSRSVKLHGIYNPSGKPGWGNYIDDQRILDELPAVAPLPNSGIFLTPTVDSSCSSIDYDETSRTTPYDYPIGMPGNAYSFYSGQWGQPGENLYGTAPPPGDNPPPGPLSTMPGPNDFNSTDPGIPAMHLTL